MRRKRDRFGDSRRASEPFDARESEFAADVDAEFDEENSDADDAEIDFGALEGRCDFTELAKEESVAQFWRDASEKWSERVDEGKRADEENREKREKRVDGANDGESSEFNKNADASETADFIDADERAEDVESENAPRVDVSRSFENAATDVGTVVKADADAKREPESDDAPRIFEPEEIADEILLSTVPGVGPLTIERLVEFFGSATAALDASRRDLERVEKVGPKIAESVATAREQCDVDALIRFCRANSIATISIRDARYPERLREIDNPPRLLYVRGAFAPEDRAAIAIVGTRAATPYGRAQTERLARELVDAGFTIVSGLALGIDGTAHRAALDEGGRTIAVLGGGVAKVYPREHEALARQVAASGAVASEYHPLTSPLAGNFPARNRIVSGLAVGTLVVESPLKSGSLITARLAAEQNREVFAVPGPVDRVGSQGCHRLIREGAALVETVDDVLAALPAFELPKRRKIGTTGELGGNGEVGKIGKTGDSGETNGYATPRRASNGGGSLRNGGKREKYGDHSGGGSAGRGNERDVGRGVETNVGRESSTAKTPAPLPAGLSDEERKIAEYLDANPTPIDELIRATGIPASRVVGTIAALEFKKVLRRREGNAVSRY